MISAADIAKFLINPLLYVFLGSFLLIFTKKHRFKLALCLTIYFYLISIPLTGFIFDKFWRLNDTLKNDKIYDAAVVLAGVSNPDWHLDRKGLPYIPADFFAANSRTEKILAGIDFVKSGHAKLLLIGNAFYEKCERGDCTTYNEGPFVRRLATGLGLKKEQVKIYGNVERTLDETVGLRKYVDNHPVKEILFVASEIDMRRASAMLRKQRLNPDRFSVNRNNENITWRSFIPNADSIKGTYECVYELVAYIGYYLRGDL